ncbi:MAG TPA: 2-amino-4-hydroxy-6-hydroxymethyldihydropteridine diphosphokinase [Cellvibrionaceae bacterium]|nr:2-amino-4-hydroxy-6-hydroxymethyldihydropteridine diphosphokinase [Cellvibrionaceae bacterium]
MTPARVYIGLGSNLQSPLAQLTKACEALQTLAVRDDFCCSPFYQSKAVGPEQPDYINACASFTTSLTPLDLLDALQSIETAQGRTRTLHWGPRTLDLDLLLYGCLCLDSERLKLPHPFLKERNFVVAPLFDLNPDLVLPCQTMIADLRTKLGDQGLTPLATKVLPQ